MSHIFLSYRRQDSSDVAGRIHDALAAHFGRESVFVDVDDIPLGADFPKHIVEKLPRCSAVLLAIGPSWLTITDDGGERRLDDESDFVRIAVETALRLDMLIVPLLVRGATMPAKTQLPPSIAALADRNGIPVRADPDFHRDIERLTRHLELWIEPVPQPTGVHTFLFTDIEGSTELWEKQREAMSRALVRHDQILREAIEGRGGDVFKTVGDAFCAAFNEGGQALQAALDAQRDLAAEDWSSFSVEFGDLKVRMGIHTGAAEARGGDYFGPALNRAARLMSAGHGGQILLSLATQQVVRDFLPGGVTLRNRGEHRLRNLRHSEHIWQVLAPELPEVDEPLETADRPGPSERVFVDETGTERSLADTLSALLGAVRSDDREVTLDPAEVRQVLESRPADLTEYRLARIAEWSQPRYHLDGRFVELTLLVDQGEEAVSGRWQAKDERTTTWECS